MWKTVFADLHDRDGSVRVRPGLPGKSRAPGLDATRRLDDPSFIIAEKELLASTLGLVTLAPIGGMRFVYQFTDNTNAEALEGRMRIQKWVTRG